MKKVGEKGCFIRFSLGPPDLYKIKGKSLLQLVERRSALITVIKERIGKVVPSFLSSLSSATGLDEQISLGRKRPKKEGKKEGKTIFFSFGFN